MFFPGMVPFDVKYDGCRGLCYLERGRCRFISRNGNLLTGFHALADQVVAALAVDEAIIDGEVFVVDETGRPQFYELLRVPRSAGYVAFDILWLHDYGFVDVEHGRHLVAQRLEAAQDIAVARDEAAAALLNIAQTPEAIVFELKEPFRVVERLHSPGRDDRLYAGSATPRIGATG